MLNSSYRCDDDQVGAVRQHCCPHRVDGRFIVEYCDTTVTRQGCKDAIGLASTVVWDLSALSEPDKC